MQNAATPTSPKETVKRSDPQRLASRYVDLVYAAAKRQMCGDEHAAADVAQAVMLIMLKKSQSGRLPNERFMAGWLIKVAHFAVMQARRAEARRSRHEARAAVQADLAVGSEEAALEVREVLDAALLTLNRGDREVIIRRYLRGETLAQVAAVIGANENTAGRRAARAIVKLRKALENHGIAAPSAIVAAVLAAELTVKAPPLSASIASSPTAAARAADRILWKMAMTKLSSIIFVTIGLMITVAAVIAAVFPPTGQRATSPSGATTAPVPVSDPQAIKVEVSTVIDGPSPAVLRQVLAGLAENQGKLRSIHVIGTVTSQACDMRTGAWLDPVILKGEAWTQGGAQGQVRDEVSLGGAYIMDQRGFRRDVDKSYIEAWDGTALYRLYGPPLSRPSAETFDTRWLHGQSLLGKDYSMQLPWDEETASDSSGASRKTIDRNPLAPSVLAQMNLAARHVVLDDGQDAMELNVINPDNTIQRSETFWFDPHRGYGLVARVDVTSLKGRTVRTIIHRIDRLAEVSPGVFYPSQGAMFWEEQGRPFQSERFDATRVVANQAQPATLFHIDFRAGVPIVDFKNGRGTQRTRN